MEIALVKIDFSVYQSVGVTVFAILASDHFHGIHGGTAMYGFSCPFNRWHE
jgi:hypothetical protein